MPFFKTVVSENLVKVSTPEFRLKGSSILVILLIWLLGVVVLVISIARLTSLLNAASDVWNWLMVLVWLSFSACLFWKGLRGLFASGESLTCDAQTLTISRIPEYVLTGRWKSQTFPIKSVRQVSFTVVRFTRYRTTLGLVFYVDGKKKKTLYGLEAPEADPILQGLSKLGVDTVHDPAMPMMIDMVLSRRKSRFGLI
jgi:hypothetical protein